MTGILLWCFVKTRGTIGLVTTDQINIKASVVDAVLAIFLAAHTRTIQP